MSNIGVDAFDYNVDMTLGALLKNKNDIEIVKKAGFFSLIPTGKPVGLYNPEWVA